MMKHGKSTKRALLLSIVTVLVCCAMLVGTTFAWFTDSVKSGNNKIVAGNLDVELYHTNSVVTDEKVDEETSLFVNDEGQAVLWEPGVMVYENLKVANEGSLALKYQLSMSIGSFNTIADTEKSLKDVLKVAVIEGGFTGDREAALASDFAALTDVTKEELVLEAGASKTYGIIVYWEPSSIDNDYNLNNGAVSSDGAPLFIDLGINLVATQAQFESDSFGNDYDAGAVYPVVDTAALTEALTSGGTVTLGSDVEYSASTNPAIDTTAERTLITKSAVLNLAGNDITFDSGAGNSNWAAFYLQGGRANLTVNGNGTVDATCTTGGYCFHLSGGMLSRPTLTINGGTYIGTPTAVNVQYGTAYINGGFFSCRPTTVVDDDQYRYTLNCIDSNYKNGTAKIVVTGGTFVNFNPANNQAEGPGTNFVADGYTVIEEPQTNGDIWYTVVKA